MRIKFAVNDYSAGVQVARRRRHRIKAPDQRAKENRTNDSSKKLKKNTRCDYETE